MFASVTELVDSMPVTESIKNCGIATVPFGTETPVGLHIISFPGQVPCTDPRLATILEESRTSSIPVLAFVPDLTPATRETLNDLGVAFSLLLPVHPGELKRLFDLIAKQNDYRAMCQSSRLLQTTINIVPAWIALFDAEERILLANERMAELFGFTRESITGRLYREIQPPDLYRSRSEHLRQCLNGQQISYHEYSPEIKRYVKGFLQPIRNDAWEVTGGLMISFDTTEEKIIEQQLNAAREEAEAANRSKNVFLSNMSHELRTPLNAIMGYAQILAEENNLEDHQKRYVSTILQSGNNLLALIDDILEIARIESGTVTLSSETFNLHHLLKSTRSTFETRASAKNLSLTMSIDESVPESIYSDSRMIRQVLINLFDNAIKFTDSGSVTLTADTGTGKSGTILRLTVTDTGKGVPRQIEDRIFDSFETTAEAVAGNRGTGLGLSISREYANRLGGELVHDRSYTSGARFIFSFPCAEKPGGHPVAKLRAVDPVPLVMIVDDARDNREMLHEMLMQLGIPSLLAENGTLAISMLESRRPKIIFLDLKMPDMSGGEAARIMRHIPAGESITIIASSAGMPAMEDEETSGRLFDYFLAKPVTRENLISILMDKIGIIFSEGDPRDTQAEPARNSIEEERISVYRRLLDAAELGSILEIRKMAASLTLDDKSTSALIAQAAERFDYDAIIALCQSIITNHGKSQ